jgi:uncharacterized protein YecA (UPF0149 family)
MQGVALDVEGWCATGKEEVSMLMLPIITLAEEDSFDFATVGIYIKDKPTPKKCQAFLAATIKMIPSVIITIYDFWREEQLSYKQQPKQKMGQNTPCPCGSGNNFKKCCATLDRVLH